MYEIKWIARLVYPYALNKINEYIYYSPDGFLCLSYNQEFAQWEINIEELQCVLGLWQDDGVTPINNVKNTIELFYYAQREYDTWCKMYQNVRNHVLARSKRVRNCKKIK